MALLACHVATSVGAASVPVGSRNAQSEFKGARKCIRTVAPQATWQSSISATSALPDADGRGERDLARRSFLSSAAAAAALALGALAVPGIASAAAASPEDNPYIKELLERSKANKEKYDKERLEDYNRRNFKEYMDFLAGTLEGKKELTENEKAILEWRRKNT